MRNLLVILLIVILFVSPEARQIIADVFYMIGDLFDNRDNFTVYK